MWYPTLCGLDWCQTSESELDLCIYIINFKNNLVAYFRSSSTWCWWACWRVTRWAFWWVFWWTNWWCCGSISSCPKLNLINTSVVCSLIYYQNWKWSVGLKFTIALADRWSLHITSSWEPKGKCLIDCNTQWCTTTIKYCAKALWLWLYDTSKFWATWSRWGWGAPTDIVKAWSHANKHTGATWLSSGSCPKHAH